MITRNQAITIYYQAWDTVNNTGKTGDVANHTIQVIKDGVKAIATNTPEELSNGLCKLLLTASEVNALFITVGGVSSTADIYIIPVHFITSDDTKAVALTIQYLAWDTDNNVPKAGDNANHTINVAVDGVAGGAVNSPSEVGATMPGVYTLVLTTDETDGVFESIYGSSSTADIIITPTIMPTGQFLPATGKVIKATVYDNDSRTGTYKKVVETDVRVGVQYGEDDVEFTGELVPTIKGPVKLVKLDTTIKVVKLL